MLHPARRPIPRRFDRFVEPTRSAATAALEGAEVAEALTDNPLNAEAPRRTRSPRRPILTRKQYDDPATADRVRGFLRYLLTDGQSLADVGFAALPPSLADRAVP